MHNVIPWGPLVYRYYNTPQNSICSFSGPTEHRLESLGFISLRLCHRAFGI